MKATNNHIIAKYDNAMDIINSMEEYADANGEMSNLIEKQMYKHGVYDGIRLILTDYKNLENYLTEQKKCAII